jgi:hypothetical protein
MLLEKDVKQPRHHTECPSLKRSDLNDPNFNLVDLFDRTSEGRKESKVISKFPEYDIRTRHSTVNLTTRILSMAPSAPF